MSCLHQEILSHAQSSPSQLMIGKSNQKTADVSYGTGFLAIDWLCTNVFDNSPHLKSIGILSNHCPETYISVLAAFFSGIQFVPLNPSFPTGRLLKVLNLANIDLVICDDKTEDKAIELRCDVFNVSAVLTKSFGAGSPDWEKSSMSRRVQNITEAAVAYKMFTSGTTGTPKGVPISYKNLSKYVQNVTTHIEFPPNARFSQLFDLSFDLAMHDIFVSMATGGSIIPPTQIGMLMPANYIHSQKLDVWFSVPLFAQIAAQSHNAEKHTHKLSLALFCGEQLPADYVRQFSALVNKSENIYNLYGPTEATIALTAYCVEDGIDLQPIVPIGLPFGDNSVAILNSDNAVIAADEGASGELLLSGNQVFLGYSPSSEKTVFIHDNQSIFYRSGDLVRVSGGTIHHLGRLDDQIKIRGFRVDYGDIEDAFRKCFDLELVAAFTYGAEAQKKLAIAYVANVDIDDYTPLHKIVPDYMIPKTFLKVRSIPTNVNGKIDRLQLGNLL